MNDYSKRRVPRRKDSAFLRVLVSYGFIMVVAGIFLYSLLRLNLPIWGFLISFFAVIGVLVYAWYHFEMGIWHWVWKKIADKLGFTYTEDNASSLPSLEGSYRGHPIHIRGFRRAATRKKQSTYTSIEIGLRENITEKLEIYGKRRGQTTLEIDDKDFNKKISVRTTSESFAKNILSSAALRQGLREIGNSQWQIHIDSDRLYFAEKSYMLDSEYLQAVLDILVELVEEVDRYNRYAPAVDEFEEAIPLSDYDERKPDATFLLNEKERGKKNKSTSNGVIFTLGALLVCFFASISIADGTFRLYAGVFIAFITLIFILSSWDKIPGTKYYKSQRTVREIKTLLREKLLPLGYKEVQGDPRYNSLQGFVHDNILIDVFEHRSNKTLNFRIDDISQSPYSSLVAVEKHFKKNEAFEAEATREFLAWLETQSTQ